MGKHLVSTQRRTLACTGGWASGMPPVWTRGPYAVTSSWNDFVQFSDNVPKWKAKIANGEGVSTTMIGDRGIVLAASDSTCFQTSGPANSFYQTECSGDLMGVYLISPMSLPSVPSYVIEKARSLAEIQFSKRFNRHTTQFETGVFAGELIQTVRMLTGPGKALRNSLQVFHRDLSTLLRNIKRNEYRSGRTATARAIKDAISGSWLEWQFGVKPLIHDLDDAARSFRALASGRTFENVRFTGTGDAEEGISSQIVFNPGTPGFLHDAKWNCDLSISMKVNVTIRGAWKSETVSGQMPLPMIFGTQLGDILPTAWELLPWSFFYDYFTNIGDVLGAWSMRQVRFNWINITTRERIERRVSPPARTFSTGAGPFLISSRSNVKDPQRIVRYKVTRFPYDNSWSPTPLVKIPGVSGKDQTKWLNIAALLAMRVSPIK